MICPSWMRSYSCSSGSFTFTTISALFQTSSGEATRVAPTRWYSVSGTPLPSPAPFSTSTLWPARESAPTPAGTMPTRYSRVLISLGMPMITGPPPDEVGAAFSTREGSASRSGGGGEGEAEHLDGIGEAVGRGVADPLERGRRPAGVEHDVVLVQHALGLAVLVERGHVAAAGEVDHVAHVDLLRPVADGERRGGGGHHAHQRGDLL